MNRYYCGGHQKGSQVKTGADLITEERLRQIAKEGWTLEHDNQHADGSLSMAAALYAAPEDLYVKTKNYAGEEIFIDPWPWKTRMDDVVELNAWDKRDKHPRMRRLVIAGALIAAEIDRINRQNCAPRYPWHKTEENYRETKEQLVAAEQRIDELLSANGSLQYKNDRLTAKTQRLEVAEKMAREARAQLAAAEQRAEKAEKDVISAQAEFVEILHNRQAKIEALKTAERNAVRECERIASRHIANAQHVAYQIRNRYPQHFEEDEE